MISDQLVSNPAKSQLVWSWWHNHHELRAGTSITDTGGQSPQCQDGLISPTPPSLFPSPEAWESQTMMQSQREGEKHVCGHCFSPGLREAGAEPQDRRLPRAPPWDWHEAVKRRGRQAARIMGTLRVRSQHCDSLIDTCCLVLSAPLSGTPDWHTPCKFSTGWETEGSWA